MFRFLALLPALLLAATLNAQGGNPPQMSTPDMSVAEYSGNTLVDSVQSSAAADFGRVFPPTQSGSSSEWVRVVVSNGIFGGATLNMTTPAAMSSDFSVDTTGFNTAVNVGSQTEFLIRFSPQSAGAITGTIQFDYQPDPNMQPATWATFFINVEGQGVASPTAWLSVREGSSSGDRVFVGQYGLGARDLGTRMITAGPGNSVQLFLTNEGSSGAGSLTVGTPAFSSGGAEFTLDTTGFSNTLSAGASTSFTVTFTPSAIGLASGTMEFTHNDSYATAPFTFGVQGYGTDTPAQLYVSDQPGNKWNTMAPVPFYTGTLLPENDAASGNRDFGQSSGSQVIQIDNGDAGYVAINMFYHAGTDLILGTPTVVGDADFTIDLTGFSTTVPSAGTTTFTIHFNPKANGARSAVIEIPHGDSSEREPYRINVTGFGVNVSSGNGGSGGGSGGGCTADVSSNSVWLLVATLCGLLLATRLRGAVSPGGACEFARPSPAKRRPCGAVSVYRCLPCDRRRIPFRHDSHADLPVPDPAYQWLHGRAWL